MKSCRDICKLLAYSKQKYDTFHNAHNGQFPAKKQLEEKSFKDQYVKEVERFLNARFYQPEILLGILILIEKNKHISFSHQLIRMCFSIFNLPFPKNQQLLDMPAPNYGSHAANLQYSIELVKYSYKVEKSQRELFAKINQQMHDAINHFADVVSLRNGLKHLLQHSLFFHPAPVQIISEYVLAEDTVSCQSNTSSYTL